MKVPSENFMNILENHSDEYEIINWKSPFYCDWELRDRLEGTMFVQTAIDQG